MNSIKLNKVSLTKGFLSHLHVHGFSTHANQKTNLYKFSFLVEGQSIAEQFLGSEFKFTAVMTSGIDKEVYKTTSVTLENKIELIHKFPDLEHSIEHIHNGLHQVAKEQYKEILKLGRKFLRKQNFIDLFMRNDVAFQNQPNLNLVNKASTPLCIRTNDTEHYFIGSVLYSEHIEVPNTFEPNSYAIADTPIESYVLKDADTISISSLLVQSENEFSTKYEALSLFTNPKSGKFDLLSKHFHQAENAFNKLKELWYDRHPIYSAYIDSSYGASEPLFPDLNLTMDEELALKTLMVLVKNNTFGYHEQQNSIHWQIVMDMCSYRLVVPKPTGNPATVEKVTLTRNNQVLFDVSLNPEIEKIKPVILNALEIASKRPVAFIEHRGLPS